MKDQNDKTRGQVDGLLRQWGASQAAAEAADELATPQPQAITRYAAPERQRAHVLLRWAPVGIAAAMLLAAGVLYRASQTTPRPLAPPDRIAAAPVTQPVDLSDELAAALAKLSDAKAKLSDAQSQKKIDDRKIDELKAKLDDQLEVYAEERGQWAMISAKKSSLLSQAEKAKRTAEDALKKAQADLKTALAAPKETPGHAAKIKKLQARLSVAVAEIKRQQNTFRAATVERDNARGALAALKARHKASLDQMRRAYLAAAAPGKIRLAALQEAMKTRKLLQRCVALQRKARTDADKKLLARAEVVLTRLGLLDLSDSSAVSAYVTQLARSDLITSLDTALGPLAADAATQDWLFETKLILTGVSRVI